MQNNFQQTMENEEIEIYGFSEETGKTILEKIREKGWNAYKTNNRIKGDPDKTIREDLAESLEVGGKYVFLPATEDPRDPKQVWDALEAVGKMLNREMPTIDLGFGKTPLTGIKLHDEYVKVLTPEGSYVTYNTLLKSLDTLVQTK